ncbi:MAG: adenosylcobinamide-GDP ribazoletransferase [Clostridia bacterium]|nr:adenosylcobinamide-GDP ribazoletransferase [Clostridia bacterium]
MVVIKRFLLMMQFLTAIPLPFKLDVKEEDFGKGLVFAPVVGLIIGGILAAQYLLLEMLLPFNVNAVLVVVSYIMLTGGLHLDGLGDTFDGLFSNRPKERILEIMRDSRVGTNAVLAIFCVLALNTALLISLGSRNIVKALLLMPAAGRIGSLIGAGASRYARSGEGLGKSFIDFCGIKQILAGLVLYALIFIFAGGSVWAYLLIIPVASSFFLIWLFSRKIGGSTGDILGAVCEINQTIFLLCAGVICWN